MINLVIGEGEIGSAIYNVLSEVYKEVYSRDIEDIALEQAEVLHICIPALDNFQEVVKDYIAQYNPELVIVHSTVPVGTCDELGVVHSPVRGVHPHLEEGLKTFTKYFGGHNAKYASKIFEPITDVKVVDKAITTELAKILSTTYYGWNIIFQKEAKRLADEHGADFDIAYTDWNNTYNEGYTKLGREEVTRPVLNHVPGPIMGHCVWENSRFLKDESIIGKVLYEKGKKYKD